MAEIAIADKVTLDIVNAKVTNTKKALTTVVGIFTTESATLVTALNVLGSGRLNYLYSPYMALAGHALIKITTDGNTVLYGRMSQNGLFTISSIGIIDGSSIVLPAPSTSATAIPMEMDFKNSLLIEISAPVDGECGVVRWSVSTE